MKKYIFIILTIITFNSFSQNEKTAKQAYQNLGYQQAVQLYRSSDAPPNLQEMERLATSFRLQNDTYNAERWYAQIVEQGTDDPKNILYYAQALHSNGKHEKAKTHYRLYDQQMGTNYGQRLADAIDRMGEFEFEQVVEVENARQVNSEKLDYSPAFFKNGIAFVSNRPHEKSEAKLKDAWTGDDFNTLYFAEESVEGILQLPKVMEGNLLDKYHEGPLNFSRSGDQVFFTKNVSKKDKNKIVQLKIFTAYQTGDTWTIPKLLELGTPTSSEVHPAISADGLWLVFASDMEGGMGGMDLYACRFYGGQWGTPKNLGAEINTPGNEVFPFIYDDGTLYFASDGLGGIGGLDIFFANQTAEGEWQQARNLGTPFNSGKDDFGYILNVLGTEGYFTSARAGGMGKDDLYRFTLPTPQSNKSKKQSFRTICIENETTGEKIPGAKVTVMAAQEDGTFEGNEGDLTLRLIPAEEPGEYLLKLQQRDPFTTNDSGTETLISDARGNIRTALEANKNYVIWVRKTGFADVKQTVSLQEISNEGDIFCLRMRPTDCATLTGLVLNKRYGNTIQNATVTLVDLCTGEITTQQSDVEGRYEFSCLPCGCDFIIKATKFNFIEDNSILSTITKCYPTQPLQKNLSLMPAFNADGTPVGAYEGRRDLPNSIDELFEQGVRVDLNIIYYDFNASDIRADAVAELEQIAALLERQPALQATLESHTDSRGDTAYNQQLSYRRAESAMNFLTSWGIAPYRLNAQGYGESKLVNECIDNVPCEETEHQMNRRTEIRLFRKQEN